MTVAGVDVGGSGIRAQVSDGNQLDTVHLVAALPKDNGMMNIDLLASLIVESLAEVRLGSTPKQPEVVCVGVSGLPEIVKDPARLAQKIGSGIGATTVILSADAVTAHVGALGSAAGTVVAAGTGVVGLGTDFDSVWDRSDGWGILLGDEGGGAWVGQQGLIAALRAVDGRLHGSDRLRELMQDRFGDPSELVNKIYGSSSPSYLLGRFSPLVARAAHEGDSIAHRIWETAGRLLGNAAIAASARVEPNYSWAGRLFDVGDLLLDPYKETIVSTRPDAVVTPPAGTPTDGALALARDFMLKPHAFNSFYIKVYKILPE